MVKERNPKVRPTVSVRVVGKNCELNAKMNNVVKLSVSNPNFL